MEIYANNKVKNSYLIFDIEYEMIAVKNSEESVYQTIEALEEARRFKIKRHFIEMGMTKINDYYVLKLREKLFVKMIENCTDLVRDIELVDTFIKSTNNHEIL